VSAIAFTATCSLVVIDAGQTLENDVIMWMDHRAVAEAQVITATGHPCLKQSGGVCSPEFSVAKILWLKQNEPQAFSKAGGFLELPDFLTWKCLQVPIKSFAPSNCSLVCKWFFDAENNCFPAGFFEQLGLGELFSTADRVGQKPSLPGTFLGLMSPDVMKEMGISPDCQVAVASSIIDAHAGVLGMLVLYSNHVHATTGETIDEESLFLSTPGTSTCHMVLNRERSETKGVWGPYLNVVTNGHYIREPGQSATGKLIDHCINTHTEKHTTYKNCSLGEVIPLLNQKIDERRLNLQMNRLVINPSFHGNRCPLADPTLRGAIYGLDLSEPDLTTYYEAVIESLCYETKFIVDEIKMQNLRAILVSGGLMKNKAFMQIYADVLGAPVVGIECGGVDMMLVGAAIMARQAVLRSDLSLSALRDVRFNDLKLSNFDPCPDYRQHHDQKYQAYRILMKASQEIQQILNN
jgi:FGGY-family pentulose kinase